MDDKSTVFSKIYKKIDRRITKRIKRVLNKSYEKRVRKKLINDNFSIISSTCVGGIIYNRLGKQFLSPTVNLWFYQDEFIKFISDLKTYLSYDLRFVEGIRPYPVAYLNDIRLFFMHYDSEAEARDAWERRKARINYDNLYIILQDTDGITDEDIKELKNVHCRNIVVLSNKQREKGETPDYIKTIKTDKKFTDKDKYGMRVFEKKWDYVDWLNSEKQS